MQTQLHTESAHLAYQRIDALLRAYGIRNAAVRAELSQAILKESMSSAQDAEALEAVGAKRILDQIAQTIHALRPALEQTADLASEKKLYLALQHTRLPERRPDILLGLAPVEAEELQRLEEAYQLRQPPALRRQSMGAPKLRFEGIEEVADGTTALFERWPYLRTAAKLLGMALIILLVYHFAK